MVGWLNCWGFVPGIVVEPVQVLGFVFENVSKKKDDFSTHSSCLLCGYSQEDLTISNFSFNSHHGACTDCHGLWSSTTFLESDIVNPELSIAEWALLPWSVHPYYTAVVEAVCLRHNIDKNVPYKRLKAQDKEKILYWVEWTFEIGYISKFDEGKSHKAKYEWLIPNLERRYKESDMGNDTFLKRILNFATEQVCRTCGGHRLKKDYLNFHAVIDAIDRTPMKK